MLSLILSMHWPVGNSAEILTGRHFQHNQTQGGQSALTGLGVGRVKGQNRDASKNKALSLGILAMREESEINTEFMI